MATQNVFEEENSVIKGKIDALDWLLCKENSCVVPLLSSVWIVWVTLFSRIQKVEDITIWKKEQKKFTRARKDIGT